jgi:secreted trypsin-like serine protease
VGDSASGEDSEAIIGGTPATAYPESVLIDIQQGGRTTMGCSGSLIAPRVVLTAGHCVADGDGWQVTAPYVSSTPVHGSSSAVYDWTNSNDQVSPDQHDVALVFLDSPIQLASYPTVATAGLPDNSSIVTVGRVKGGQLSHSALYVSEPIQVRSASSYGFNFDYAAPMHIERGDSGGASYKQGTHTIVAVNSTGDNTSQIIARVDLVSSWIQKQVAAHPADGPVDNGGTNDPGTDDPGTDNGGTDNPGGALRQGWYPPGPGGQPPGPQCQYFWWYRAYYCW